MASRDQKGPEKSRKKRSEPERSAFQPLEIGRTNREADEREQEREEENRPSLERKRKSKRKDAISFGGKRDWGKPERSGQNQMEERRHKTTDTSTTLPNHCPET